MAQLFYKKEESNPVIKAVVDPEATKEAIVGWACVKRNAWYIENALRCKLDDMREEVAAARKTLALPTNDGSDAYVSLKHMADHVEHAARDFQKAYDALVAAGVK